MNLIRFIIIHQENLNAFPNRRIVHKLPNANTIINTAPRKIWMNFSGDPSFRKRVDLAGRSSKERDRQKLLDCGNTSRNLLPSSFRYSTDYGMFRFCIANTEHDWREGTEQYNFIEHCLATVDFEHNMMTDLERNTLCEIGHGFLVADNTFL